MLYLNSLHRLDFVHCRGFCMSYTLITWLWKLLKISFDRCMDHDYLFASERCHFEPWLIYMINACTIFEFLLLHCFLYIKMCFKQVCEVDTQSWFCALLHFWNVRPTEVHVAFSPLPLAQGVFLYCQFSVNLSIFQSNSLNFNLVR